MKLPPTGRTSRLRIARCALALGVAAAVSGAEPGIILHLRNGDRLSGVIVAESADQLTLRSSVAGRLKIPKEQILRRETPGAAAVPAAVTPSSPTPTPAPATPAVATPPPPAPVPTPGPAGPGPLSAPALPPSVARAPDRNGGSWIPGWIRPWTTNWHGNVGLGFNLGIGTADRQTVLVTASAAHTFDRFVNNVNFNAAYGTVNSEEANNRVEGALKTDFYLDRDRRLYTYNLGLGGYDKIRQIEERLEESIGMGYRILQRRRFVLNGELGGQYQFFNYTETPERSIWSIRFSQGLNWKPDDKLNINQRLTLLPSIEDFGDFRFRFELIATYPLYQRLTVSLNAINEYESKPARAVDNNDLQITTNVNYSF
ncbi:MAG: DUF481 domain-containing protein [Verrucomicrobiota bacterium]